MNTAKMREKARYYESILDWHNAALCWADAIKLYPQPYPKHGELQDKDIQAMTSRMKDCEYAAQKLI